MYKHNSIAAKNRKRILLIQIGSFALIIPFLIFDFFMITREDCVATNTGRFGRFFDGCYGWQQWEFWANNWFIIGFTIVWIGLVIYFWQIHKKEK